MTDREQQETPEQRQQRLLDDLMKRSGITEADLEKDRKTRSNEKQQQPRRRGRSGRINTDI